MSQLNLLQTFTNQEKSRHELPLNGTISSILDHCEYVIGIDFNASDKSRLKYKNRKKQISRQFTEALTTLSRQEKIQYYFHVLGAVKRFCQGDFTPPKSPFKGVMNDIGYSRSFNVKRWKDKKLRLDQDRHLMYAERESKIKTYDLKDYILRKSKNTDYHSFVLEAINNHPPQKSRTVHIGFQAPQKLSTWFQSLKFSVDLRQWELFYFLFKSKPVSMVKEMPDQVGRSQTMSDFGQRPSGPLTQSMVDFGGRQMDTSERTISQLSSVGRKTEEIPSPSKEMTAQKSKLESQIKKYEETKEVVRYSVIIDDIMDGDGFEEPEAFEDMLQEHNIEGAEEKKCLDLFHRLYPQYELSDLQQFLGCEELQEEGSLHIYRSQMFQNRIKASLKVDKSVMSQQDLMELLSKPENNQKWNENIKETHTKTFINSQNSAIMYQVLKPFNRLYRSRDFIFIRHVFRVGGVMYMIDKSIDHGNYPPFMTIVRGQKCNVFGIFPRDNHYQMIFELDMNQGGYINTVQTMDLTLKYLKPFSQILKANPKQHDYKFFDYAWDISKNKTNAIDNQIRVRKNTIKDIQKKMSDRVEEAMLKRNNVKLEEPSTKKQETEIEEKPHNATQQAQKSFPSPSMGKKKAPLEAEVVKEVGELTEEEAKAKEQPAYKPDMQVVRKLDENGYVVIETAYRTYKAMLEPQPSEKRFMDSSLGHPIWKDQWIHDDKEGGIIFIHKKKLQEQKGVLSFVLNKIAKNLLSGQSILSISLPVDIFSPQSNLQRFLYSMIYGPLVLEGLEERNPVEKMINTIVFGMTNSVLYLNMEKPFNPILGETFQCWINGCPAYAEQISHHPPIAALIFKGRGYDVTAQLESKVSLSLNSGTGTNDGIYRVKFKDQTEVCFITPGGEVSGLTRGDRKFNLVGKCKFETYYWIETHNVMLEITFDPYKKGFFSVGKALEPSDYYEGTIWQVKPEFMAKFVKGKHKQPQQKDRIRPLGKISGVWNLNVCYNDNEIFNINQTFPLQLEYQSKPLPSDSNWREDIEYRRRGEVTRSQTEKERLQVLQRKDRKFREKQAKKKK